MEMTSYKELVATRETREDDLRKYRLASADENIQAILDEEELRQQCIELIEKIVAFGKELRPSTTDFSHLMIYRNKSGGCKSRRGALLCPAVFLDKKGIVYLSLGRGGYYDMTVSTRRYGNETPYLVIPIRADAATRQAISPEEIKLVGRNLRDHLSMDWDFDPTL